MADPHGTGEVSWKALSWGLECEDTNLHQPFFYGSRVPRCFPRVSIEQALMSPPLLPWEVNAVRLLAMEVAATFKNSGYY